MPLIILSGLPTSGKSTRAQQLYDYLEERIAQNAQQQASGAAQYRLHLISDDSLSIPRSVYDLSLLPAHTRSANAPEKDARAALYGAVKRVLSPRDIVLLDGLNYIKGWRYQLSCEAKNVRTPHAVLQIGCSLDRARAVNEARRRREGKGEEKEPQEGSQKGPQEGEGKEENEEKKDEKEGENTPSYSPENWDNLVFRYEEPNGMTRWDSPLFVLTWDDDEAQARTVFSQIWDAVAGDGPRKDVRPNMVAVPRGNDGGGDYLYLLDRETQDIVKRILQDVAAAETGVVRIPRDGSSGPTNHKPGDDDLILELPGSPVGLPQLQRLRRAFLGLNRGGIGLEGTGGGKLIVPRLRESFVGYLNDAFEKQH